MRQGDIREGEEKIQHRGVVSWPRHHSRIWSKAKNIVITSRVHVSDESLETFVKTYCSSILAASEAAPDNSILHFTLKNYYLCTDVRIHSSPRIYNILFHDSSVLDYEKWTFQSRYLLNPNSCKTSGKFQKARVFQQEVTSSIQYFLKMKQMISFFPRHFQW